MWPSTSLSEGGREAQVLSSCIAKHLSFNYTKVDAHAN